MDLYWMQVWLHVQLYQAPYLEGLHSWFNALLLLS